MNITKFVHFAVNLLNAVTVSHNCQKKCDATLLTYNEQVKPMSSSIYLQIDGYNNIICNFLKVLQIPGEIFKILS